MSSRQLLLFNNFCYYFIMNKFHTITTKTAQLRKIINQDLGEISRLKEMRLTTIKNQIMNILFPVGTPPVFPSNITNGQQTRFKHDDLLKAIEDNLRNQKNTFTPGDVYTEKVQSFYPSCELPRNTDEELWSHSETMNLLFDLAYPLTHQGTSVNIVAAKLRLYKLSQGNLTVSTSDGCPPPPILDESSIESSKQTQLQYQNDSPFSVEDKQIRVSIYWYTRSLKKHRVKRKLLDSQMLSVYGELWTEWNIRGAVKAWRDSGRNFGLAVEVEDEDGALLPAHKYFAPMNCSKEASTSRPIPGFLVARALAVDGAANHTNSTTGHTFRFDTFLFPLVDLCTIEFPESEKPDAVYYHKVPEHETPLAFPLVSKKNTNSSHTTVDSNISISNETEKHKIRHHNHRHPATEEARSRQPRRHLETVRRDDGDSIEEITWADDLDGHQLRKHIIVQKVIMKSPKDKRDSER